MNQEFEDIMKPVKSFVKAIATEALLEKMEQSKQDNFQNKEFLTVEDVCRATGLSKSTIYTYVNNSRLSYFKPTGKNLFFKWADIQSFIMDERHYYRSKDTLIREAETIYVKDINENSKFTKESR